MADSRGEGPWQVGQRLADRYEVREVLQHSSTCCLYRAHDVFRSATHLILGPGSKIMTRVGGLDWFEDYCSAMLRVPPHPNLLTPKRMDHDGGVPFVLLPNAEGKSWYQAIRDGDLRELPDMLSVAIQVARGVAWLHRHDCIHYNVKPRNVILCERGFAKVWKYGESGAKTRAYASPEQMDGDRLLSPATDAWSWALSVLEMFAGRPVWRTGDQGPEALRHYLARGPAVRGIPPMPGALAELLRRCFRDNPTERPAHMSEVVAAVESIAGNHLPADQGDTDEAKAELEQQTEQPRTRFRKPGDRRTDTGHWRLHQT